MKIGFTGTRKGMSRSQVEQLQNVLDWFGITYGLGHEFHHGDAIGADSEAKAVARDRFDTDLVIPHPAGNDPLARNREIVALCDVLVAAPYTDVEERRGGTWHTVRRARDAGKPVVMLSRGKR